MRTSSRFKTLIVTFMVAAVSIFSLAAPQFVYADDQKSQIKQNQQNEQIQKNNQNQQAKTKNNTKAQQQGSTPQQNQQNDANCVKTSIIGSGGEYCDDGEGGGVYTILNIALTILTFGVGIAATAGLIICGIKYATSGTNEAQATNARRRIFEIVIGLIAYALMYLALQWLIPGFNQG